MSYCPQCRTVLGEGYCSNCKGELHVKPYTDLMIDLETFDTHPMGVVSQVGWCFFNMDTDREFFTRSWFPDIIDQQGIGRTIDINTLQWWNTQPTFMDQLSAKRQPLEEMMEEMVQVWDGASMDSTRVWAKGVSFDIGMWRTFLPELWSFRNVQCLRTLKLVGDRMGITVETHNEDPHDAVADAVTQAKQVQALCSILKRE